MIKLVYSTDWHVQASNPTARLDNFKETILKKLRYKGEFARSQGADALIVGGDIFNRPDNPESLVREVQQILADIKIPVYGIIGNHDEYGYNPETFYKTSFGLLDGPKVLHRLTADKPTIIDRGTVAVSLTGCDAHYELDKNGRISDYTDFALPDGIVAVKIHVVHGFLADHRWPDQVPHTLIEQIKHTKADIVLTGHDHNGFGIIRIGNKIFCNPGALARVSAAVGDVNLEVKLAVITVDKSGYDVQLHKLPIDIARPANEVLDREKLVREKQKKEKINNFIQIVAHKETNSSFDIYQTLEQLGKEDDIPDNIVEGVRKRLEAAEAEIGGDTSEQSSEAGDVEESANN